MDALSISVCLPAYNSERYIEAAVESVLAQTFDDFELLIHDDGSTDRTLQLLQALAKRDPRVRLTSAPNVGLITSLNQLLARARGSLIARMDSDDICRPERFARQAAYFEAHPDCVAVGSRSLLIDPEGWPLREFMDWHSHDEIDAALLRPEIGMLHPTVMIRRSALQQIGGYRDAYPHVEDLDLFLRLAEVGRLCNLPDVLLDYRCHASSVSHRHAVKQSEAGMRAVAAALARRGSSAAPATAAPLTSGESAAQLHRKWAWWALGSGHLASARKHARLALVAEPLNGANLRLMASVLRDTVVGVR